MSGARDPASPPTSRPFSGAISAIAQRPLLWFLVFALLIALTQIGTLEQEVIDWDESTFILMAADVLRGNLPYVELFDNKPPMMFFALAGAIAVFGESLVTVRVFGDVCLFLICIATFQIGTRLTGVVASGLGVAMMIAASAREFAQYTQTEHLALVFLMSALWLSLDRRMQFWAALLAGFFVALAVLTRSNLAYVAVAFGLYYTAWVFQRAWKRPLMCLVGYTVGGLIPLAALLLIYWAADVLDTLLLSTFEVALAYANEQDGMLTNLFKHIGRWAKNLVKEPQIFLGFTALMLVGFFTLISRLAGAATPFDPPERQAALLILLIFGATFFAILKSGAAYSHYWNQILPFFAIFIAVALAEAGPSWPKRTLLTTLAAVSIIGAVLGYSLPTLRVLSDWRAVERAHPIRQAAEQIKAARSPGDTVWALKYHLVLWYLGDAPISPILTHPSTITRKPVLETLVAAGYVPENEFERLMESKPAYLVMGDKIPGYIKGERRTTFSTFLDRNYKLWRRFGEAHVYRLTGDLDLSRKSSGHLSQSYARFWVTRPDQAASPKIGHSLETRLTHRTRRHVAIRASSSG